MQRHLVLRLDAPLVSFGGEAIDNFGVIRPFPAKSMIAGMLANAAGVERYEYETLQSLQDNLVMGSLIRQGSQLIRDFQTAGLSKNDQGWTTREQVEGRGGGAASYKGPHLRYRDFWTDTEVSVVFRVLPASPFTFEQIGNALQYPARPLFVGRKTCIPSRPVYNGDIRAHSVFGALISLFDDRLRQEDCCLQWPAFEASDHKGALLPEFPAARLEPICDERNWITGVHAGERLVFVLDLYRGVWE